MGRRRNAGGPKKKPVTLRFVSEKKNPALYELVNKVRQAHHGHLEFAKIAVLWMTDVKPDQNGNIPTGKAKLASGSVRATAGYDLELHLNEHEWELMRNNEPWRESEIDRLLCFFLVAKDKEGDDRRDVDDRKVYRMKRPDVVGHREHLRRHKPDDITMLGIRAALECTETRETCEDLFSHLKSEKVAALPKRGAKVDQPSAVAM